MSLDKNVVSVDFHVNGYKTIISELQQQVSELKQQLALGSR